MLVTTLPATQLMLQSIINGSESNKHSNDFKQFAGYATTAFALTLVRGPTKRYYCTKAAFFRLIK